MPRREWGQAIKVDHLYIENLIGAAINELRDMRDLQGKIVHTYHNLTKIKSHLDKYHNIKIDPGNGKTFEESREIKQSNKLIKNIYTEKANKYKRVKGNNYSFNPIENKPFLFLKAVGSVFRM